MPFGDGRACACQAPSPLRALSSDHLPLSPVSCPLSPACSSAFLLHLHWDDVLWGLDRSLVPQQQSYPTPRRPWAAVEEMPLSFPPKANAGPGVGRTPAKGSEDRVSQGPRHPSRTGCQDGRSMSCGRKRSLPFSGTSRALSFG